MKTNNPFNLLKVSIPGGWHFRTLTALALVCAALSSAMAQTTITNVITGSVGVPGERDVFAFDVAADARFYFDSLTNVSVLNWTLKGPSGTLVANRSFASSDAQSVGDPTVGLPVGGYTLTIQAPNAATGGYAFRLVNLAEATLLVPGTVVTNNLSPANKSDFYQFNAVAGDQFYFQRVARVNLSNAYWRLLDPYGNQVFSQGFTDVGTPAAPVRLSATGTYTVLLEGYIGDTGSGSYAFIVSPEGHVPPPVFTGTAMNLGDLISGNIVANTTTNYVFAIANPARVVFDTQTNSPSAKWTLQGPSGLVVNQRAFNSSDWASGFGPFNLPVGDYQLSVKSSANGPYVFRLMDLTAVPSIVPGTAVANTLSPASMASAYQFSVGSAGSYYFNHQSSSGLPNTYWRLLDPFGKTIFNTTLSNDQGPLWLSNPGTYSLLIEGYYNDTGIGSNVFNVVPVEDGFQALAVGSVVSAAISLPGQTQRYTFTLGTEAQLYFDSLTNNSQFRWWLDGPTGNVVYNRSFASSDAQSIGTPVIPVMAGDYTLRVSANGDNTGGFQFRLSDLAAATPLTPGTPVNDTLNPANATAAYRFTAAAGDRVFFDSQSSSGLPNAYWRLIDPDGQVIFSTGLSNDPAAQTLSKTGTYLVLIEGYIGDNGTGTYGFNVQPFTDGFQALALGGLIDAAISSPGQTQRYTFTLGTEARLYFDSLTNNSQFRWWLDGPTGNVVYNRSFASSDAQSIGTPVIPVMAGDYTLRVSANGDNTGGFQFRLSDLAAATPLTPGTPVNDTLNPANATAAYRFTAAAGDRVFFDSQSSSGLPNAYWRLIDPDGQVIFSTGLSNDPAAQTLSKTGTYLVLIEGYIGDNGTGTYGFNVQPEGNVPPATLTGTPLIQNTLTSGTLATSATTDSYTFSLAAPARLYFDALSNNGIRWYLVGPGGVIVNNRSFQSSDAADVSNPLLALPVGDYQLNVTGLTGDYAFRLLNFADAVEFTPGTLVSDALTPANSTVLYKFTANAGDPFYFDGQPTTGFSYQPFMRLYGPLGNIIQSGYVNADIDTFTLPQTGVYTLTVEGRIYDANASGNYGFNLVPQNYPTSALVLGSTVNSNIPVPGERQRFTFTLPSDATLYFDALKNANFSWRLDGPSGQVINWRGFLNSDANDIGNPALPLAAGNYTLTVAGNNFNTTGDYAFRLLNFADAVEFTPGTLVSDALTPANSTVLYKFTANAGDPFYFDGQPTTGFSYQPFMRLYGPLGNIIQSGYVNADIDTFTLPQTGVYTLTVEGRIYDANASGNYGFNLVPNPVVPPQPIFTGGASADLIVSSITVEPPSGLQSGGTATVHWTDSNVGDGPTGGSFMDRITIRNVGNVVLVDSLLPYNEGDSGPILDGGSRSRQLTVTLRDGPNAVGTLQVTIATDAQNGISESNEANNLASFNFNSSLAPYPDLQVGDLVVDPAGGWSPGETVTVTWRLDNTGDLATAGDWSDSVILRNVATQVTLETQQVAFTEATDGGPIGSGDNRIRQTTFTIPNNANAYGLFEITATANSNQALYEYDPDTDASANNQRAVQVSSAADLQINNVQITGVKQSGGLLNITWQTTNSGNAAAGTFYDRLQINNLTTAETLFDQNIYYNSGSVGNGLIEPGTNRSRSATYRLPDGPRGAGNIEVVITADRYNAIKEYNGLVLAENNNSATAGFASGLSLYPDLVIQNLQVAPATTESGEQITITWMVRNQGAGVASLSWYDRITIVNTNTGLTVLNSLIYQNVSSSGPLASGQSVARQHVFQIPDGEAGTGSLHITLLTDAVNSLFEFHATEDAENNNSATTSVESSLAPYPDLLPTDLSVDPVSLLTGRLVNLNWATTNSGSLAVSELFQERVVIRNATTAQTLKTAVINYDPSVPEDGPIPPGQSRDRQYAFQIPDGPTGTGVLEFTVTTDYGDRLFEYNEQKGGETNNVATVSATSSLASYPDLLVSGVTGPASALPGENVEVSWTVENIGPAAASGSWSDQIFVSSDSQPGGDTLLGTLNFNGSIPSGQSVVLMQSVTMPAFASSDRWFVVKANSGRVFYEPDYNNNTSAGATPINLPANLNLTLSRAGVSESGGTNAALGYVSRNTDTAQPLTVQLMSGDSELVTVPDSVTILAGQTTASFRIGVINDFVVNGSRNVDVLAVATGFNNATKNLVVTDNDRPVLTFQVPRTEMTEGGGDGDALGYITRNAATNQTLEVNLGSSFPLNAAMPTTVTMQPGESIAVVTITAPDNATLDGTRTVSLQISADGYNTVSQTINVVDNDLPALSLTPVAASVVEGAESPATTGVISRAVPTGRPVELLLIAQPSTPIQLPPRVSIPAGASQVSFNINVLDDPLVNGSRTINLIARLIADDGRILTEGATTNVIDVFDNDGPTLTLATEKEVVNEGETLNATVTRNTETSQPLTVQLSVDDTTELSVPTSVQIPAGQSSIPFVVNGIEDGVSDGVQSAFISAAATGFNSGTVKANISDGDLPDLAVSHIIVPATGRTDARAEVTWRVSNNGKVPAMGSWTDRVYISTDNQLGNDLLAVSVPSTAPLGIDAFYVRNQEIVLPSQPGTYHIIVITDSDNALLEGSERNNQVSVATIDVAPSYRATVETDVAFAPSGSVIPMHGRAFYTEDDSPALYKLVTIRLNVNNTRRVVQVLADGDGNFTYDFQPLPTEAGIYSIGADHPLVDEDEVQDQFRLLGMRANPKSVRWRLIPNEPQSGTIEIMNASDQLLTGLSAAFIDPPEGFNFQLSIASDLFGNGKVQLNYTALTTITNQAHYQMTLEVNSVEGAVTRIPTTIDVSPLRPLLVANPPFLKRGMLRGAQSIVSFEVSNVGGSPSGDLAVLLPDEPWIQLASTSNIPSLAPGEMTTVTLTLNPAADLPLLRYDGQLALAGGRYGLNIPFQFRAVSDALGDLRVRVTDEYTYFVEGAPQVTNATVRLRDPISGADVAEGVTDETGVVLLTGIPEGAYTVEAFATKHTTHRSTVNIVPGIEIEKEAFISRQTVTYQWSVVPIEIEDHYRIVLESVFETEVPIPNVIIENPFIMPLVVEGEATQFEITLRNEGLIAAENVKVIVPNDPRFLIIPLVDEIGTIPAKSRMTIPVTIQLRNDAQVPAIQLAGYQGDHDHAHDPIPRLQGEDTCEIGVHDCLPKISLGVIFDYTCGDNKVTQARKADLTPICTAKAVYDCFKSLVGAAKAAAAKGNLAAATCEVIDALLGCAGADLSNCEKAAIQTVCRTLVGGATGGLAGAAAGAASGLWDSVGCLCDIIKDWLDGISGTTNGGTGGGGLDGTVNWGAFAGGFGGAHTDANTECLGSSGGASLIRPQLMGYQRLMGEGDTAGVCARVRIRIEQQAVMTRAAFLGTLEIENDGIDDLSGVRLTLDFRDEQGNPAGDMFVWRAPKLSGISDVDGGGTVFGDSSVSVQYTFIPTREAAEFEPTNYRIGGTLRYIENGVEVVVPMLSSTITVFPEARLKLKYFQSRDVFSDDPFTDEVEPAEPFALGLIAQNIGAGAARNFRITSAQPEIIENEKGLLIDFKIIGTTVGDETFEPTLTANLGTIEPGASQVAQWLFLSSLQGKFIEYTATFEHLDSLGSANLSLIDSVEIHELIHPVQADRPGDDARPDFLVNDVPDPDSFPDTLYFSDGPIAIVEPGANGVASGTATLSQLSVGVTATMPTGWGYLVMNDPGPGLELWKVVDSNDRELLVNKNVWTTDRTFPSSIAGAVRENKLHILDYDGTGSYTLYYRPTESIPPEIVSIAGPTPLLQTGPVASVDVEFSELIDLSTFGVEDLFLSLNSGANLIDGSVTVTEIGVGEYRIGGLTAATGGDGNYLLVVDAAGIEDLAGNPGIGMASTGWAKGSGAPVVVGLGPVLPNPRNTPVTQIDVEFSSDMNPTTIDLNDVSLRLDGGANLIDNGVTITPLDARRFRIGGLNGLTLSGGLYDLTVSATGVEDDLGSSGVGQLSASWLTVTTGPAFADIERLATNPRNIVVLSLDVFFQSPINSATFDYRDLRITRDVGQNLVTGEVVVNKIDATTYRISNFNWVIGQQGTYTLTVDAAGIQDMAGNVGSGSISETWEMITTRPIPPQNLALVPDLGKSSTDLLINNLKPNLQGTAARTGLTLRVRDMTLDQDLGAFPVTGTTFSAPLNFAQQGTHRLKVNLIDNAANVSTDVYMNVFIDTTPPLATVDPVTPTPRNTPVNSVVVRFSEAMNQNSFALADATLKRDSSANLIAAPISWTKISTNVYSIGDLSGVTDAPGNYTLTFNLAGLEDEAGNPGIGSSIVAWQRSGANTKPTIASIPNLVGEVGVLMLHTNTASDVDLPANQLIWSLDPGAPGNANIDQDRGVFSWRPARAQAPGDYPVTVRVTDNGVPSLSDTRLFTVSVGDYSEVVVGTTIVESGTTGIIPLTLLSSTGVTNVSMKLSLPGSRFTNLRLTQPLAQSAASTITPLPNDLNLVEFRINEGLTIVGSNRLAFLEFDAVADQQSAFVPLTIDEFTAPKADGTFAPNILTTDGRIIVVDKEPLLESVRTNGQPRVLIYGRAGDAFEIDVTENISGTWTMHRRVPMTSNRHTLTLGDPSGASSQFFRARVFTPNPPLMELLPLTNGWFRVVGYGEPELNYLIESNNSASPTGWVPVIDGPLTNSFWLQEVDTKTGTSKIWRFKRQ